MTEASVVSPAVEKPEHVPESLVYDFDMLSDPAYLRSPEDKILQLMREAPPIFWTPRCGGQWMFIGFDANLQAAKDVETFSSEMVPQAIVREMLAQMPEGTPRIPQPFPINLDPPEHGKYRIPVQSVFSPKTIAALKSDIRELAAEILDGVRGAGQCEFMAAVAEPLPVRIFLRMLGLPEERMAEYRALVREQMSVSDADPSEGLAVVMKIADIMRDDIVARRDSPQDDILSYLWKVEVDGRPITQEEIENYGVLLFIAGLDTVMNAIGYGVLHIARDQALQKQLRDDPALIPQATEELLRRFAFVNPIRRVNRDTEFQGVSMKEGERVRLFLSGANMDSGEFPEADKFDLYREGKAHIVFNAGPHRCLGSHLARAELQILYEELLMRLPQFELDPDRPPVFHGGQITGPETLYLRW